MPGHLALESLVDPDKHLAHPAAAKLARDADAADRSADKAHAGDPALLLPTGEPRTRTAGPASAVARACEAAA
jgi:hypothetical protein